jgi:hypothetical protein
MMMAPAEATVSSVPSRERDKVRTGSELGCTDNVCTIFVDEDAGEECPTMYMVLPMDSPSP